MNKTQRIIILTGNENSIQKALGVIEGFKAITIVNNLSKEIIENVFKHNKNVLIAKPMYNLSYSKYNPVVLNVVAGNTKIKNLTLGLDNVMDDFPKILDYLNIDSGDHISKDSTDSSEVKNNCFICKVIEGKPEKPEHILYESKGFIVLPGLGAFFDGYVMIVPKRHVMSFAELSKKEYEEFLHVLNDMRFILESIYKKKIFVFECGSGRNGGGKHKTSIVHAHIHMAPTDMPVLKCIHKSGIYPALINPRNLKNYGEYPYMLYIDQENNWYITGDPDTYFPRQHPRQVLADYMGLAKGEYNWRTNPLRERMDVIAEEFYGFIRKEFNNLPVWIQNCTKNFI
ncbi:MAG: hypothetical protein U0L98_05310 [Clostridia bacterium]|nr:hypothetical protein [Clostridia bacterium]